MYFSLPSLESISESWMLKAIRYPDTQNLIVQGAPGTGKTVVALHRFLEGKKEGKKVLLLCFNKLLREFIVWNASSFSQDIKTIDSLWYSMIQEPKSFIRNASAESLSSHFAQYVEKYGKFESIIIDEAQDLTKDILNAILIITDHVTILLDENQIISDEAVLNISLQQAKDILWNPPQITLNRNYRNTKEIYTFAAERFLPKSEFANDPMLVKNAPSDPSSLPEMIRDKKSFYDRNESILAIIDTLPHDSTLGILVPDKDSAKAIWDAITEKWLKFSYYSFSERKEDRRYFERINIVTHSASKGLEFDTVIVVVYKNRMPEEKINEKLYVLSSRAKKKLYFIFNY